MNFSDFLNLLINALYFIFWVLSFLKLSKEQKGIELFFKWMFATLLGCLMIYAFFVIPQRNCVGFNCFPLTQELALQIDLLVIFLSGLALNVEANKHETLTSKRPLPSEDILDHFSDK